MKDKCKNCDKCKILKGLGSKKYFCTIKKKKVKQIDFCEEYKMRKGIKNELIPCPDLNYKKEKN